MAPITTRNDPYVIPHNKTELQYGSDNKFVAGSISKDDFDRALGSYVEEDILEPIAIVGFSLKFSQEATTPEAFWKMLMKKRCFMTEWPKERLNVDAFYHPNSSQSDTVWSICSSPLIWYSFQLKPLLDPFSWWSFCRRGPWQL